MPRTFDRSGFGITYPDDWKLEVEETEDGWCATIFSPDTAFLMLSYHENEDDPAAIADMALQSLRESYPELESEDAIEAIAGQPVVGYDVDFIALDLTNTCWIRALAGNDGCLLMMGQCTDDELGDHGQAIRSMFASLTLEDSD
jgi:hypothetical protein